MSNRFLGTSSSNTNLTNGTADLYVREVAIAQLTGSLPVKTNAENVLVSTKLLISDTDGLQTALNSAILNPLESNLNVGGFNVVSADSSSSLSLTSDNASVDVSNGNHISITPLYDTWQRGSGYGFALAGDTSYMYDQSGNTAIQLSGIGGIYNGINFQTDGGLIRGGIQDSVNGDGSVLFKQLAVDTKYKQLDASIQLDVAGANRLMLDGTDSRLISPNTNNRFEVSNALLAGYFANLERITVDTNTSAIASPSQTSYVAISNAVLTCSVNAVERLRQDATNSDVFSPNGLNRGRLTNSTHSVNFNGVDRFLIGATNTTIYGKATSYIDIGTTSAQTVLDGIERLSMTNIYSRHFGGGASNTFLQIADSGGGGIYAQMAGQQRVLINATNTQLISPDNLQHFTVANTGCTFNTGSNSNLLPTGRGTTGQVLTTDGAGALSWAYRDRMVFTQTATATVANTLIETSLLGSGVGSLVIPANTLIAGSFIKFRLSGYGDIFNINSITLKVKINGTTIQTLTSTSAMAPNVPWELFSYFTCYTTGAGGTAHHYGRLDYDAVKVVVCSTATFTLDTTIANTFSCTIQHGVEDVNSSWTSTQSDLFLHV